MSKTLVVNEAEIAVCGLSRSGNHAVINWILRQTDGHYCFLNCAEGKTNPFRTARPLANDMAWETNIPEFDIERERQGIFQPKSLLLHSYEDSFLAHAFSPELEECHRPWLGTCRRRLSVLVLRDPYNLFASRYHKNMLAQPRVVRRIWKQHAREFLGLSRKMPAGKVLINFNEWSQSRAYRRQVAAQLGLRFTDSGIDDVQDCADGSSFDGTAYNGRARLMRVNERWQRFADDRRFWALFDEETHRLARRIFGPSLPLHDEDTGRPSRSDSFAALGAGA